MDNTNRSGRMIQPTFGARSLDLHQSHVQTIIYYVVNIQLELNWSTLHNDIVRIATHETRFWTANANHIGRRSVTNPYHSIGSSTRIYVQIIEVCYMMSTKLFSIFVQNTLVRYWSDHLHRRATNPYNVLSLHCIQLWFSGNPKQSKDWSAKLPY